VGTLILTNISGGTIFYQVFVASKKGYLSKYVQQNRFPWNLLEITVGNEFPTRIFSLGTSLGTGISRKPRVPIKLHVYLLRAFFSSNLFPIKYGSSRFPWK
jgi:hypothetical protein